MPAVGYGSMRSYIILSGKLVKLKRSEIAMAPRLSHNVFSLRASNQNSIEQTSGVITLLGGRLRLPIRINTRSADAYRSVLGEPERFAGSAVIARGHTHSSPVDVDVFQCCHELRQE